MTKTALLFPGQGSQTIGMGKSLFEAEPVAKEVFQEIDDALGQNLSSLMFDGDADALNLTENTQPALMAVSVAVMRVLEKNGFDLTAQAQALAGHSLGEYSAYAAAGSFSLSDTARLLQTRGQAMQKAVPVGQGAMAAILGLEMAKIQTICQDISTADAACSLANDNCPGQVVVSGHKEAVEAVANAASEQGAKRAVMLPVSAPFHCNLMSPAAETMAEALGKVSVAMPRVPVYTNVTTAPAENEDAIRALLVEQVTGQVRWRETMEALIADGFDTFVEIGTGKVLTGLMRRIHREATVFNVETPDQIDAFLAQN